ncbi:hypothetical protein SARC_09060 [Sphaeroforma arctica JP610]|uniref:Uncharacterized protein n=1 Tax=Sphaeroforma arctica JP610 TaxID=667725 RepID=A0A0L0FNV2_9EUKA|nr:hypothetical protein SARC_09060 [Sphaeroforma arctica JP610]KNC78515.1 hypothetical protein SARC_09060 [Sphaeroforma arctica JP610]|eukprot:XP_014152417.1 hypothetical protein SARC_09060 [Sphaeroforma arctica JP610]
MTKAFTIRSSIIAAIAILCMISPAISIAVRDTEDDTSASEVAEIETDSADLEINSADATDVEIASDMETMPAIFTEEQVVQARAEGIDLCTYFGGISFFGHEDHNEVCCSKSCGECGAGGCGDRDGGYDSCCISGIIIAEKVCADGQDAPCVLPGLPLSPF